MEVIIEVKKTRLKTTYNSLWWNNTNPAALKFVVSRMLTKKIYRI
jgi:hypothetical protein